MKARRKIIDHIATSADGYIARSDGDVEWLNRLPRTADYGMRAFYQSPGVEFVSEPIKEFAQRLCATPETHLDDGWR